MTLRDFLSAVGSRLGREVHFSATPQGFTLVQADVPGRGNVTQRWCMSHDPRDWSVEAGVYALRRERSWV